MKLSRERSVNLYDAIYEPIMNLRIKHHKGMTKEDLDQKLSELETEIYKRVCKALNTKE